MSSHTAPATLAALLERAAALGGVTLGHLAGRSGVAVPRDQRRHKGWVGRVVEDALGAESGSLPRPDFPELGVEVKTLPVNARGRPRESTFVCVAPTDGRAQAWPDSPVRAKLACVLWVPVEADNAIPMADRRIGTPFLWRPTVAEESQLRGDWEEIMDMITLGRLDQISARHGRWLQLRPKAANAGALTGTFDADGRPATTLPRGFYLRAAFTAHLLAQAAGRV